DQETELLVEIMDIQDELTIVKTILTQQHDVLEKLLRLYPKKIDEDADEEAATTQPPGLGKGELMVLQSLVQLLRDQTAPADTSSLAPRNQAFRNAFKGAETSLEAPSQRKSAPKGKEKEGEPPKPTA